MDHLAKIKAMIESQDFDNLNMEAHQLYVAIAQAEQLKRIADALHSENGMSIVELLEWHKKI